MGGLSFVNVIYAQPIVKRLPYLNADLNRSLLIIAPAGGKGEKLITNFVVSDVPDHRFGLFT